MQMCDYDRFPQSRFALCSEWLLVLVLAWSYLVKYATRTARRVQRVLVRTSAYQYEYDSWSHLPVRVRSTSFRTRVQACTQ
eukprot:scaffold218481_cov23-Prasinocladus_malaysianus.AAC.1